MAMNCEFSRKDESLDDDDDDDSIMQRLRSQRLHSLKLQQESHNRHRFGGYDEASGDAEILQWTTTLERVIVHFAKREFKRCQLMDEHLRRLATAHSGIKFTRVEAERVPFLVAKLRIQTLPCVIPFINGAAVDRIIGFEGLVFSDQENFSTRSLEMRLVASKAIVYESRKSEGISESSDSG